MAITTVPVTTGGEELPKRPDAEAQHHFKYTADQACAHNDAVGIDSGGKIRRDRAGGDSGQGCSRNTVIDTDKARGRAHNDRQFSADGTEGIQLEQGYDAGNEHRVLQKGNPEVAEACAGGD